MTNLIIASLILSYGFCVHLNYLWFKEFVNKNSSTVFWICILSGPILSLVVIKRRIKIKIRKRRKRKEMREMLKKLPEMLKEFNITLEDGIEKEIPNIIEEGLRKNNL